MSGKRRSTSENEEPLDIRAAVRKSLAALESANAEPPKAIARRQAAATSPGGQRPPGPRRGEALGQPGARRFVIPREPEPAKRPNPRRALSGRDQDARGLQVWPPTDWSLAIELENPPKSLAFGPSLPELEVTVATIARLAKTGGDILVGVSKTRRASGKTVLRPVGVSRKAATRFMQGLDSGVRNSVQDATDLRFSSASVPIGRNGQVVVAIRVFASQRTIVLKPKLRAPATLTAERAPVRASLISPRPVPQAMLSTSPRVLSAEELEAYKQGLPPTREEREKRAAEIRALLASSTAVPTGAASQYLDWEVLPPGEMDSAERIMGGAGEWLTGRPDPRRLKFLLSLRPVALFRGSSLGQRVYVVAVFPKVAVADTGQYGNALYYYRCTDNEWMRVFRKDKIEARRAGAQRLIHTGDWEGRVRRLVGR